MAKAHRESSPTNEKCTCTWCVCYITFKLSVMLPRTAISVITKQNKTKRKKWKKNHNFVLCNASWHHILCCTLFVFCVQEMNAIKIMHMNMIFISLSVAHKLTIRQKRQKYKAISSSSQIRPDRFIARWLKENLICRPNALCPIYILPFCLD